MRIVVGIGGGIAAYKATMLLRLFAKAGHDVVAMPTETALQFIGKPTLEALSGHPVSTSVFDRVEDVNHVRQAEKADAILVAPATADLMARLAQGRADDLLSATILTTHAPVILAPAMHTQMWEHPATQRNLEILASFGYHIIPPAVGRLTGPDSGIGRLPEPEEIFENSLQILGSSAPGSGQQKQVLAGRKVLITAGGTREALDPVRYLGNRSSGKQGIALAQAAQKLGAEVTLICAHLEVPLPAQLRVERVSSALELKSKVEELIPENDVLIMAAAVADFRPDSFEEFKIKKSDSSEDAPTITLVRNPDILRETVLRREAGQLSQELVLVGFAAETGSAEKTPEELGRQKLIRKGCDFLAVNTVGLQLGFGQDDNSLTILNRFNQNELIVRGTKEEVSYRLLQAVADHLAASPSSATNTNNKVK